MANKHTRRHFIVGNGHARRSRHENLSTTCGCGNARRSVDIQAVVISVDQLWLACMQSDSDPNATFHWPWFNMKRPLNIDSRANAICCMSKHRKKRVAVRGGADTEVLNYGFLEQTPRPHQNGCVLVAQYFNQLRGPFNVREQKRYRFSRRLADGGGCGCYETHN
jgi:hypothetical protein